MISDFSAKRWSVGGLILMWLVGVLMGITIFTIPHFDIRTLVAFIVFVIFLVITGFYLDASEKEWLVQYNAYVKKWEYDKKKSGDDEK